MNDEALLSVSRYLRRPINKAVFALLSPRTMSCSARGEPSSQIADITAGGDVNLSLRLSELQDAALMTRVLDFYDAALPSSRRVNLDLQLESRSVTTAAECVVFGKKRPNLRVTRLVVSPLSGDTAVTVGSVLMPRDPRAITSARCVADLFSSVRIAHFTSVADIRGAELLPSLEILTLSNCFRIAALSSLRGKLPHLSRLALVSCRINDADLAVIVSLRSLQELVLEDIMGITTLAPLAAPAVGRDLPLSMLTRLECTQCVSLVSARGLEQIRSIKVLSLSGCRSLPVASTTQLLSNPPACIGSLDISAVTVAWVGPSARSVSRFAALHSLVWVAGRWAMEHQLLTTYFLHHSVFPTLRELRVSQLRPMSNIIAAEIVRNLPSLTLLELGSSSDEVTSLSFLEHAGPLLADVAAVFAVPFGLDHVTRVALQGRRWQRLVLHVDDSVKWKWLQEEVDELILV